MAVNWLRVGNVHLLTVASDPNYRRCSLPLPSSTTPLHMPLIPQTAPTAAHLWLTIDVLANTIKKVVSQALAKILFSGSKYTMHPSLIREPSVPYF